mmetsp:Transcript_24391/g.69580  ORF Transcript_24391/g.69580 Transcript_24391/m.69580 type:complete len:80 (+) Transcript_24391:1882-2121(+)
MDFDKDDAYTILGVQESASDVEIRRAYFSLARAHHPDRQKNHGNGGSNQTKQEKQQQHQLFCRISNAYQILSDHEKRRE